MTTDVSHKIETIETHLLRGQVTLLQPKVGFHASVDSVFLSAAVPVQSGQSVLDIGCGVGSASLCVTLKNKNIILNAIDIQSDLIKIARENAILNNIAEHAQFFCGNLLDDTQIPDNAFDSVLMNPPFQEEGTHIVSPEKIKSMSHGEDGSGATLLDWIKYAHKKVRNGGYLTMIHRTDRLDDIITALTVKRWFGSVVVFPLWPHAGDPSKRVIICARKERYAPLRLLSGLVVHTKGKGYTQEAEDILSGRATIDLGIY